MSGMAEARVERLIAAAPLLAVIDHERARGTRSMEQIAADCGIASTQIRSWRRREGAGVEAWTADKVLTGLGVLWWECYDAELFPEAYVQAEAVFG